MRILITGATGFIGKYLVPLLNQHQLFLLGRKEASFSQKGVFYLRADLADIGSWGKQVNDFSPEACIHLAWEGLPDYSIESCQENFNISTRLFEFITHKGCKKIFSAGTCWEYGDLRGAVKEEDLSGKLNQFASFKTSLRLAGERLADQRKINFIWGRIFFVYGPGQRNTSLIPSCYRSLVNGQHQVLKNPGTVCDFIYVTDVAAAIKSLIETEGIGGIFNIGSGHATEVGYVCHCVAQTLKVKYDLPDSGDLTDKDGFWADISLISGRTGWKPQMSIDRGVDETICELRKNNGSH